MNSTQSTSKEVLGAYKYGETTKTAITLASTIKAVFGYHPFRTISIRLGAGETISFKFRELYKGITWGLFGAHQIFVMGIIDRTLKEYDQTAPLTCIKRIVFAGFAGACTAPTITPIEAMTVWRQLNRPIIPKQLFTGCIPIFTRQVGLGISMFALPFILKESFPVGSKEHEKTVRIICSLAAGAMGASFTQLPEVARIMMQADPKGQTTTVQAFKAASKVFFSGKWAKIFYTRLIVLAIATGVMNTVPDMWFHFLERRDCE